MKIHEKARKFNKIIIEIETEGEVKQLLDDIHLAESSMVNETFTRPLRNRLHETSRKLADRLDEILERLQ